MQRVSSVSGSTVAFQLPKGLRPLVLLLCVTVAHGLIFMNLLPLAWRGAALFYVLCIPGLLVGQILFRDSEGWPIRILLGAASSICLQTLLIWLAHVPLGPVTPLRVLLPANCITLFAAIHLFRLGNGRPINLPIRWRTIGLILILGLAAFFRFRFLGTAEFQSDEANVVLLAVDSVIGHEEILQLHRKGPTEILLTIPPLALFGVTNEWLGRLPFAAAGMAVVYGAYVVTRRVLRHFIGNTPAIIAGLVAASILALNGFLIAFARQVQYQNVVLLMMLGAFWCGWRIYTRPKHTQAYFLAGSSFAAVALLSHYDGAAILPILAWFIVASALRYQRHGFSVVKQLTPALAWFSALVLAFYIPFVLNPQFQSTFGNLQKRTGQHDQLLDLYDNIRAYEEAATVYSTTFQIRWLLAALVVAAFVWLLWYTRPRWLGLALATVWAGGWAIEFANPDWFAFGDITNGAIVFLSLPLVIFALLPRTPLALKALLIWFLVPYSAETFVIGDPKTHFYSMDVPFAMLVGLAFGQALVALRTIKLGWLRPATAIPALALVALAIPHQYLIFIRQVPEYRVVFPAARPDIYKASYGDVLPARAGYFGFPRQAGWRVIGELYRNGTLRGNYESNEDYYMTLWYIGHTTRCGNTPEYYILSSSPLHNTKVPTEYIKSDYHLFGTVFVHGQEQIQIYSRQPVDTPQVYQAEDYTERFDNTEWIHLPHEQKNFDLDPYLLDQPLEWGQGLTLLSSKLREIDMVAGQSTTLTIQLQALQSFSAGDELRLEARDQQGNVVKNFAGSCASMPIDYWHTQEQITVTFPVAADADIALGDYELRLALYRADGSIIPLSDGQESYHVADYTVTPLY